MFRRCSLGSGQFRGRLGFRRCGLGALAFERSGSRGLGSAALYPQAVFYAAFKEVSTPRYCSKTKRDSRPISQYALSFASYPIGSVL